MSKIEKLTIKAKFVEQKKKKGTEDTWNSVNLEFHEYPEQLFNGFGSDKVMALQVGNVVEFVLSDGNYGKKFSFPSDDQRTIQQLIIRVARLEKFAGNMQAKQIVEEPTMPSPPPIQPADEIYDPNKPFH